MIRLCFFRRRPSMARPICRGTHSARHCRAPARRRPPCSRRSVFGPRSDSLSRDLSCIVTEPLSLHCHCLHFFGIQSQCTLDLLLTNSSAIQPADPDVHDALPTQAVWWWRRSSCAIGCCRSSCSRSKPVRRVIQSQLLWYI